MYGGTNRYFDKVARPCNNLSFTMVDFTVEGALEAAITPKTKMVWLETPTNPTLKIVDIEKLSAIAHKHNLIVVTDNTFASPFLQSPLELGSDIVVHSVTKYIGGHSDVVMGVLATNNTELYTKLKFLQNSVGAVPAPFDWSDTSEKATAQGGGQAFDRLLTLAPLFVCLFLFCSYMAHRGVKTLPLRMREHCKNAQSVAEFLENHPLVDRVIYPGLISHPQHQLAKRQMRGFGGMITFFLKGGLAESRVWLESLSLFALAESLGAVESLAEHPAIMTHASVPADQRVKLGISDSLIRLSVGCEDLPDLIKDLSEAFDKLAASLKK